MRDFFFASLHSLVANMFQNVRTNKIKSYTEISVSSQKLRRYPVKGHPGLKILLPRFNMCSIGRVLATTDGINCQQLFNSAPWAMVSSPKRETVSHKKQFSTLEINHLCTLAVKPILDLIWILSGTNPKSCFVISVLSSLRSPHNCPPWPQRIYSSKFGV